MAGAPISMGPSGGARKPVQISMNPINLANIGPTTPAVYLGESELVRPNLITYHPQVDVSTQVDLHGGTVHMDWDRRATPLYSREDIKEQYCITSRQLDAVERSGGGIFGCLTNRGPSPCSSTKASILSACVRSAPSDENLCDAPYPRKPLQIMYQQPYSTYPRGLTRYKAEDDDWVDSSYFRRRPKSFCTVPDPKRWDPPSNEKPQQVAPVGASFDF